MYKFNIRIYIYIYIHIEDTYTQADKQMHTCIYFFLLEAVLSSHLISSHLISFHPIQSNPIPSHFISSHLISSNLISSHLISSHLISSHLSLSVSIASTMFLHIHLCWCEPAKYPSINPSMHRSICLSSWSIQKNLPSSVPSIGPSVPCRISGWDFHVSKQTRKMLLVDPSPDGYRWISMDIDGYR